jgi:hypothetical protein
MSTVPATGQFGNDYFSVYSTKGVPVEAKWLRDGTGSNYIIDPNPGSGGKPYIVPADYDPRATITYFSNKLKDMMSDPTLSDTGSSYSSVQTSMYTELKNAFVQGGWGDIQRPLADKTDVVSAFIPAASFNLGVGAAAGGVSAFEAIFFGGMYNVKENGLWKLYNNPLGFGNNPDNPQHIQDGADEFHKGMLGPKYSENSTTSPDGEQTTQNIDIDGDGHTDIILTSLRGTDNTEMQDVKYLTFAGATRAETSTERNASGSEATTKVDANGDGRWDTRTVASAGGQVKQNDVVNDDGTSNRTVFDDGTQSWSSETSAFDAYQRLQSQRVILDDGSQQVKEYDPNNTHPYDKLEVAKASDGKVTAAQVTLDPNVLAAGMSVGQIFGSALGAALGGNSLVGNLVGSTVGGLIGRQFVQVLATSMTTDLSQISLKDAFAGQGISIANAGIGVVSSFLTAELGHALHIDGFDGQLFNTAVSGFTTSLLSQVTSKMVSSGLTFDAAIAAIDWSQALTGAIDAAQLNLGNLLGS